MITTTVQSASTLQLTAAVLYLAALSNTILMNPAVSTSTLSKTRLTINDTRLN